MIYAGPIVLDQKPRWSMVVPAAFVALACSVLISFSAFPCVPPIGLPPPCHEAPYYPGTAIGLFSLAFCVLCIFTGLQRVRLTVDDDGFCLSRQRRTGVRIKWTDTENFRLWQKSVGTRGMIPGLRISSSGLTCLVWSDSDALRQKQGRESLKFAAHNFDHRFNASSWGESNAEDLLELFVTAREAHRKRTGERSPVLPVVY